MENNTRPQNATNRSTAPGCSVSSLTRYAPVHRNKVGPNLWWAGIRKRSGAASISRESVNG
jgi:hypothetical protein